MAASTGWRAQHLQTLRALLNLESYVAGFIMKKLLTCNCPPQAEQIPLSSTVAEDSSQPLPWPASGPLGAKAAAAASDLQRTWHH